MKKNVLAVVLSLVFGGIQPVLAGTASSEFKPLTIQSETPEELQPAKVYQASRKQAVYQADTQPGKVQYSLGIGYTGTYLRSSDLSEDDYFNGVYVKGQAQYHGAVGAWLEYGYNRGPDYHYEEVAAGIDYQLLDQNRIYGKLSLGLGYAWTDLSASDLDDPDSSLSLKYITLPVAFDLGYRVTPNIDVTSSVGYKWVFNKDAKYCYQASCSSDSESGFNTDGAIYKIGVNYRF